MMLKMMMITMVMMKMIKLMIKMMMMVMEVHIRGLMATPKIIIINPPIIKL